MIYSKAQIATIAEGGKILSLVKDRLAETIAPGVSAWDIEQLANSLFEKYQVEASFKTVPDYKWATCVNVNAGIVHGIPKKEVLFKPGDLVSVDLGVLHKGFHTDSSISVAIKPSAETRRFWEAGREALLAAIDQAVAGNRIWDISRAIERMVEKYGYHPVKALAGHGVGHKLHEEPMIPCFTQGKRDQSLLLKEGMVVAIEVMYTMGSPDLVVANDGWTIETRDGKMSGLFEETVAVGKGKPQILTGASFLTAK